MTGIGGRATRAPVGVAMTPDLIVANGVSAETGEYLLPPLSVTALAAVAAGRPIPATEAAELRALYHAETDVFLGLRAGLDPSKLEEAGWAVVFARDTPDAVREALQPLLERRRAQAGPLFLEMYGPDGYRPVESKYDFLARRGAGPGPADPDRLPYYVLLVGSPQEIPFEFQYQLDVQYAVGRLSFASAEQYARYAETVVAAETGHLVRPRRAAFFGPSNPGDKPTTLSAAELVQPLSELVRRDAPRWEQPAVVAGPEATKARLKRLLGGDQTPALLFTASHGIGFSRGHRLQERHQGALICQDWGGPGHAISGKHYFCADDLTDDASVAGLVAFNFACFGAGTPLFDEFALGTDGAIPQLADRPFLAALPSRLLSHPGGAALAVVGHVERAWGFSFLWPGSGRQIAAFRSALDALVLGQPLGAAMEAFNVRYAELGTDLNDLQRQRQGQKVVDETLLAGLWTSCIDARNYLILGDPAVRLAVGLADGPLLPGADS